MTDEELKAIGQVGLTEDELNALLLRGLEAASRRWGVRARITD